MFDIKLNLSAPADKKPETAKPAKPNIFSAKPAADSELLSKFQGLDLSKPKQETPETAKPVTPVTPATNPCLAPKVNPFATKSDTQLLSEAKPILQLEVPELAQPSGDRRKEKHEITFDDLNTEQRKVPQMLLAGENFILQGSAGTGKSTTQRVSTQILQNSQTLKHLDNLEHKYLPKGIPSVAIVTYMNKAAENIRDIVIPDFKPCVITIHKFLEFQPVMEVRKVVNTETGETEEKEVKVFRPMRNADNLVEGFTHIIVEEASTVEMPLWEQFLDALPERGKDITFMFMGDICQITPPFNDSILKTMLPELPRVVLTEVYRTALESNIKRLAVDINSGALTNDADIISEYAREGELEFYNISLQNKRWDPQVLVKPLCNTLQQLLLNGDFVPFRDTILCPYNQNKSNGINCELINQYLAEAHGKYRKAVVHEVVAGFKRVYLAVGDPIIYNKRYFVITNIKKNDKYRGVPARPESEHLDRTGHYDGEHGELLQLETNYIDELIALEVKITDPEDAASKTLQSSHTIVCTEYRTDNEVPEVVELSGMGELMDIQFAYAISVHKSIGSEWEKVHFILHHSMKGMLTRELVYTAITRAKKFLKIYYDGPQGAGATPKTRGMLSYAAQNPEIKGNTVEEKIKYIIEQAKIKSGKSAEFLAGFTSPFGANK